MAQRDREKTNAARDWGRHWPMESILENYRAHESLGAIAPPLGLPQNLYNCSTAGGY